MKRWLPWLVLAACARPPEDEPTRSHDLTAGAPVVGAPVAEPASPAPADVPYLRSPLRLAPHTIAAVVDGTIAELAVPSDGGYAVSLDTNGGVLLWPTLDGKREPIVVPARIGAQIATVRDGEAIAIAVIDKIGQLELVRLTADGNPIAHDDIAVVRPIVQLVATGRQLLALRDDQVLAAFDAKGVLAAELEAPSGERIAQLVTRGDRVVGVSPARRGKHTARALVTDGALAWGAPSKRFECDDDGIALAPDGKRVVATIDNHEHVVQIELARGTATQLDHEARDNANTEFVVGVTDHHSVIFTAEGTAYERADKDGDTEPAGAGYSDGAVLTSARTIGGVGLGYLIVFEHGRTKYLGYRSGTLSDVVAASDGGWLATDGGGLFRLDATLRFAKTVDTPFPRHPGWEGAVAILDEHHAIIADDSSYFLYRLGAKSGDLIASETYGSVELVHSTGLAVLPDRTYPSLVRWNAKQGKFEPAFQLPPGIYSGFVRLFDPAATNGVSAMFVDDNDPGDVAGKQRVTFHEVYGTGAKLRVRNRVELVANDLLFSGHSGPALDTLLPAAAVRATSTDGTLIAELANDRITLLDRDGNVRWARTADGARGLAWNSDDDLIAFGAGIARVDLTTGDYSEQRCGWDFGLWTKAPETQTSARMCVLP
jgi:hypothetical protein